MIINHQTFSLLDKVVLERVIFEPPLKAGQVMHDEACLIYAIKGNSTLYSELETKKLNKEESVLMKCGSFLNSWNQNDEGSPGEAIAFHFYPDVLTHVYKNDIPDFLKSKEKPGTTTALKINYDAAVTNFFNGLLYYFENPDFVNDDLLILKVKELILLLYNTDSHGIRDILSDLFNPSETEFKDVIKANLFNNLSLEDYAYLTNLSLSSFKRSFRKAFNESPAKYIKTKRLEKAADLLRITSKRVSDICFDCGFNDVAHFSKSFAAQYDCSPSDYRKQFLN
ncbi:MAG: AraC family transcriptional regulator [Balneolales bacterium]|nr:AraC family transcriptional regulator [Balneolales bacterium]